MILSNTAIFEALDDGRLVLDPEPTPRVETPGGEKSPFDTTAVDLRLGPHLSTPKPASKVMIDLARPGGVRETLDALTETVEFPPAGHQMEPGTFLLGQTLETIHLALPEEFSDEAEGKPTLAARVEGKSSLARFGLLIHFTAPTIHAGYNGRITLEMLCLGEWPLWLKPGIRICQLIIEQVDGEPSESESEFQGQLKPTGAN